MPLRTSGSSSGWPVEAGTLIRLPYKRSAASHSGPADMSLRDACSPCEVCIYFDMSHQIWRFAILHEAKSFKQLLHGGQLKWVLISIITTYLYNKRRLAKRCSQVLYAPRSPRDNRSAGIPKCPRVRAACIYFDIISLSQQGENAATEVADTNMDK